MKKTYHIAPSIIHKNQSSNQVPLCPFIGNCAVQSNFIENKVRRLFGLDEIQTTDPIKGKVRRLFGLE